MPDSNSRRPLGRGEPRYCTECGDPYREVSRLPGIDVERCPTCFEALLRGG